MIKPKQTKTEGKPHKKRQHVQHKAIACKHKAYSAKTKSTRQATEPQRSKPPLFGVPKARETKKAASTNPQGT